MKNGPGCRTRRDIHRELKHAPDGSLYAVWNYPRGTRLIHRVFLKPSHRLIELRLEQKLEDGWAFGVYRPQGKDGELALYQPPPDQEPESVELPLPGSFGRFRWTRLAYGSCRMCHVSMGPGWYQYSDTAHAGPCGFVPLQPRPARRLGPPLRAALRLLPFHRIEEEVLTRVDFFPDSRETSRRGRRDRPGRDGSSGTTGVTPCVTLLSSTIAASNGSRQSEAAQRLAPCRGREP